MIDDYEEPPDGWEPTPEQWALLKDAPNLDPDAHMGGEREAAEGRRWLEERERERAKVKRLELRLLVARATSVRRLLFIDMMRCRLDLFRAATAEGFERTDRRHAKASNRIVMVNGILSRAEKELANVNR